MSSKKSPAKLELKHVTKVFNSNGKEVTAVEDSCLLFEPGELVTILGPSGCGKTTNLRMIAGFETPTSREILLDGEDITSMPPNKRPMSLVFQSYALFPHLSVKDNVAFGLKIKKVKKEELERRVAAAMEAMHITEYANRGPHELSGGQQQRVALARALVMEPRVLLFDEPLSNLDAKLRDSMRLEIRRIQREFGITSIFVTHDQDEAMTMSDKIVVMSRGRVEQVGTPWEVYRRPKSRFVSEFLGDANFIPVSINDLAKSEENSTAAIEIEYSGQRAVVPVHSEIKQDSQGLMLVRAEQIEVYSVEEQADQSGMLCFNGEVKDAVFYGDTIIYAVALDAGFEVNAMSLASKKPYAIGQKVSCLVNPMNGWVLPKENGDD